MWGKDVTVVIAGLTNTYSSYVTTFEEYAMQRYEGASTIFGPHTLDAYIQVCAPACRDSAAHPCRMCGLVLNSDVGTGIGRIQEVSRRKARTHPGLLTCTAVAGWLSSADTLISWHTPDVS